MSNILYNIPMQDGPWRAKAQEIFQTCQDELKRATEIGKKMISASKVNSNLHNAYEGLGVLVAKAIKDGKLQWDDPDAKELLTEIEHCEKGLENLEKEVEKIRNSKKP